METPNTNLNAENLSSKPDAVEVAAKTIQNDPSIINAKTNRKHFMNALEDGSLACLPQLAGKADVSNVINIVNGTKYKGMTTLLLKNFSKINGYPTNEYMTMQQLEMVNMEKQFDWNHRLRIRKGEHGIKIDFSVPKHDENGNEVKDPETGKTVNEKITAKLFNIAQIENPEKLVEWAKEQAEARYEYAKEKAGDKWREPKQNLDKVREVVNATSSEPAQYLAEYFDAMERGKDFTASKEIVDGFKAKTKEYVYEGLERKPHVNPYRLNMLGYESNKKLHEIKQARSEEIRQAYGQKSYEEKLKNHRVKKNNFRSMSDDEGMSMSD